MRLWRFRRGRKQTARPPAAQPRVLDLSIVVSELDAITPSLLGIQPVALRQFDRQLRSRSYSEPTGLEGWFRIGPSDVERIVRNAAEPALATALLSMHTNGHVRETAITALRENDPKVALRFLLLRLLDWVPQVRERAAEVAVQTIAEVDEQELVRLLPLVEQVAALGSSSSKTRALLQDVTSRPTDSVLIAALGDGDLHARHAAARLIVARGAAANALDAALRQHDPMTASVVARAALQSRRDDPTLLRTLLDCRFASLAAEAAFELIRSANDPTMVAVSLLLDTRKPVRSVAQYEGRRSGVDVADFYRDRVREHPVALTGIGECGARDDAPLAAPFLDDPRPKTRCAATNAVGRLDVDRYRERFLALLRDASPAVARAAARALVERGPDSSSVDAVVDILDGPSEDHVRRAARYIALRLSRWQELRVALVCLRSAQPQAPAVGIELLDHVLAHWNRASTDPSPLEREEIASLLPAALPVISGARRKELEFALVPYRVAR